jgi:hypothetical protein
VVGDSTPTVPPAGDGARDASRIDVELTHTFPVTVDEAFAYITDVDNWPAYWPGFVRLESPAGTSWHAPGDRLTIVVRLLGRETALKLSLEEFRPSALVRYTSEQDRLPPARHERHFVATPDGFRYTLSVSFEPRRGPAGAFDRVLVKRAIASALQKTVANLERVFATRRPAS